MPLLVFTTKLEEVRTGKKRQTIRANAAYWSRYAPDSEKVAHIWLGSPRTNKKAKKLGCGHITNVQVKKGYQFKYEDAVRDGFESVEELVKALADLHKWTIDKVLKHEWAIIQFTHPWLPNNPDPMAELIARVNLWRQQWADLEPYDDVLTAEEIEANQAALAQLLNEAKKIKRAHEERRFVGWITYVR